MNITKYLPFRNEINALKAPSRKTPDHINQVFSHVDKHHIPRHNTRAHKILAILLLSTDACHLCELANQLLSQIDPSLDLQIEKFDVKTDHQLFHLYGARIPVLKRLDNNNELGWPFDLRQLQEFLG